MTTALIVAVLLVGLPVTIGPLLAVIRHDGGQAEHQGADERYAAELAAYAVELLRPVGGEAVRPGRHSEDTIDLHKVAQGWMPPVGAARFRAAVDATAEMTAVQGW
jgi:hypothetical protein